jgi:hypothetical protein
LRSILHEAGREVKWSDVVQMFEDILFEDIQCLFGGPFKPRRRPRNLKPPKKSAPVLNLISRIEKPAPDEKGEPDPPTN